MTNGQSNVTLRIGTIVHDRYRIDSILGDGGFGITYKAYDIYLNRDVALKECMPSDFAWRSTDNTTVLSKNKDVENDFAWAKQCFREEAQALARFRHNNILSVNNIFDANGTVYIDSTLEVGDNLGTLLKEKMRNVAEEDIRRILESLLNGLRQIHKAKIIHRDIKPDNIVMRDTGEPVLIDFGSARMAVNNKTHSLTAIVTKGYAPFEQYYEDGNQGAWTDIYSLAAVCYRMITGKVPPEAFARLKSDKIIKLSSAYANEYSAELLQTLDKCLEVDEASRPQTVDEVLEILKCDKKTSSFVLQTQVVREEITPKAVQKTSLLEDNSKQMSVETSIKPKLSSFEVNKLINEIENIILEYQSEFSSNIPKVYKPFQLSSRENDKGDLALRILQAKKLESVCVNEFSSNLVPKIMASLNTFPETSKKVILSKLDNLITNGFSNVKEKRTMTYFKVVHPIKPVIVFIGISLFWILIPLTWMYMGIWGFRRIYDNHVIFYLKEDAENLFVKIREMLAEEIKKL